MQAIITQYSGPTNSRGSRFKATAEGGRGTPLTVTVPYDYALNSSENHAAVARALAEKYNWSGRWVGGGHPDGKHEVWVLASSNADSFTVKDGRMSATVAARKAPKRRTAR